MAGELKPGDVIYLESDDVSGRDADEELNTACVVVRRDGKLFAVFLDGGLLDGKYTGLTYLSSIDGWHRTQDEANRAAAEREVAYFRRELAKLRHRFPDVK